jgi:hypothetical protein
MRLTPRKWTPLQVARDILKANKPLSKSPEAFRIIIEELVELKKEVKKIKDKLDKS